MKRKSGTIERLYHFCGAVNKNSTYFIGKNPDVFQPAFDFFCFLSNLEVLFVFLQ